MASRRNVARTLPLLAAVLLAGCAAVPAAQRDALHGGGPFGGASVGLELVASIPFPMPALANDLAIRDGFVYMSTMGSGSVVIDVRDPEAPQVVGAVECGGIDVGVFDAADGRRIMTLSSTGDDGCPGASPAGGVRLVDVTRPDAPVALGQVALPSGSHTHTALGDTGVVYNSQPGQRLAPAQMEILDLSDPDRPRVASSWPFPAGSRSPGCHDVLHEPALHRAICAAVSEVIVLDVRDPLRPRDVATFWNPLVQTHHSVATTRGGDLLVLTDEAGTSWLPQCTGKAPLGALWAYDLSDPETPRLLGSFTPPAEASRCTAHNGGFLPGTDLLVVAFFGGGTLLVDFSRPEEPVLRSQVRPPGADAWSSYPHGGHVFVGDRGRGFDVLRIAWGAAGPPQASV